VQAPLQFLFQGPQLGLLPLAYRLSQNREVPLPGPCANVRETQEVERLRLAFFPLSPILFRKAAKLDDTRLIGVQLEAEVRESLAQLRQEPLCFPTILESRDEIIGKTHKDYLSVRLLLPPSPDPEVEYIMQIGVRQQRANTPTLNRTYLTLYSLTLLQHAGFEPFLDQAHDAPSAMRCSTNFTTHP
jgi:hypothetical protein